METVPKAPVLRNALCPCGSGKRYKHCHGEAFAANRFAEFEARFFADIEHSPDPVMRLDNGINRLIMEDKSREAAALLILELPRLPPANAPQRFEMRTAASIKRLLIGNNHQLMQNADAADIEEACGLPVILGDLKTGQGMEHLAAGTLLILTCHAQRTDPEVLRAIRALSPDCMIVVWLFDNHHSYLINAQVACSAAADLCFPSHPVSTDYLSGVAPGRIGPVVPLATGQWSRRQLTTMWKRFEREERSDALSGHYTFYALAHRRNALLAQTIEKWPQADLSLRHYPDMSYHSRSPEDRYLQWRRYKVSVCLPVANDLSNRFFDALATGQVPIVREPANHSLTGIYCCRVARCPCTRSSCLRSRGQRGFGAATSLRPPKPYVGKPHTPITR